MLFHLSLLSYFFLFILSHAGYNSKILLIIIAEVYIYILTFAKKAIIAFLKLFYFKNHLLERKRKRKRNIGKKITKLFVDEELRWGKGVAAEWTSDCKKDWWNAADDWLKNWNDNINKKHWILVKFSNK